MFFSYVFIDINPLLCSFQKFETSVLKVKLFFQNDIDILLLKKVEIKKDLHYSLSSSFEGHLLQVRHKQDWGRGFILLLPQTASLPESDAGSGVIKLALSFVIQYHQTSCSMWYLMYRARC